MAGERPGGVSPPRTSRVRHRPIPLLRKSNRLTLRHLDKGQGLSGGYEEFIVALPPHFELTPEPRPLELGEFAVDDEGIAELGRTAVVDLGAGDDGEQLRFRHRFQVHAHDGGKLGAAGLDHPQVGDVVDHTTAVGIEKHDFLAGDKSRAGGLFGVRHALSLDEDRYAMQ